MEFKASAGRDKDARELKLTYDYGDAAGGKDGKNFDAMIKAAVKLFGPEVVWSNFLAKGKIAVQDMSRRLMKLGKTDAEIIKFVSEYKLGVAAQRGKSQLEKTLSAFEKLTDEEKAAVRKSMGL